jgi:hypothetical protein
MTRVHFRPHFPLKIVYHTHPRADTDCPRCHQLRRFFECAAEREAWENLRRDGQHITSLFAELEKLFGSHSRACSKADNIASM